MREIEDAHEALDRVKNHVDRMRWIIQNPGVAECIIVTACSKYDRDDERGLAIVRMIDEARGQAGYADQWPQRTIDQMLARRCEPTRWLNSIAQASHEAAVSQAADAHRVSLYRDGELFEREQERRA